MAAKKKTSRSPRVQDDRGGRTAETTARESDGRTTRAQEARAADVIHEEYADDWEEQGLLAAPDPRPGFVQRWVRTALNGNDDPNNIMRKLNQGWRPRAADSAPAGVHVPTIQYGTYGNVIGVHGMILMERPAALHQKHGDRVREATRNQMRAVDETLFKVHAPGKGFNAPTRTSQRSVTTGRAPKVADDE